MIAVGAEKGMTDVTMSAHDVAAPSVKSKQGKATVLVKGQAQNGVIKQGGPRGSVPGHEHTALTSRSDARLDRSKIQRRGEESVMLKHVVSRFVINGFAKMPSAAVGKQVRGEFPNLEPCQAKCGIHSHVTGSLFVRAVRGLASAEVAEKAV